jgi:hypothetical protein
MMHTDASDNPRITVAIPTRNRSQFLRRAVESVLAQDFKSFEIVVSDNASDDDSFAALSDLDEPRLIRVRQPVDSGLIGNFNACLHLASGRLFLLLSDDDLLEPGALRTLSEPLIEDDAGETRRLGLSWSPCFIVNSENEIRWITQAGPRRESSIDLICGTFRGTRGPRLCSVMLRTEDVRAVGGFRSEYGPICDVGCWTRVALCYSSVACAIEPQARYTMHVASISSEPRGALWQASGEAISTDLTNLLTSQGRFEEAQLIATASKDIVTNLIVTIMMQYVGKPGWIRYWISEVIRAPKYFFSRTVLRRLLVDGRKLFR